MCARHGAYYRQMAEDAHEGLRGATGPMWRERLTSELGNLRAALDWFIARADADAALSLASGMAWLWCINSDCVEGARWLGDALGAAGPRHPELAATSQVWHGYFVCGYFVGMALSPAAAVLECEEAVAALTTSDDRVRRAEALVLCATVLMRAHEFERSLDALSEAHDLLEPAVHGWQLALHDLIVAWNLALPGRLDDAEQAAHSSVERFDAALGATIREPEVAAPDFLAAVDLSVTSAPPQASQANWHSCSQHKVSPSARMMTWTPPGPPLRTTAARSPQACGPRRGTGMHSEPWTAAEPPQRCASPSKPTRRSSSPAPTSTPLPEPAANVTVAGR